MKIWIDTASGTWGDVDGDSGRLLIVDIGNIKSSRGLPEALETMSDSEIIAFGDEYGHLAS